MNELNEKNELRLQNYKMKYKKVHFQVMRSYNNKKTKFYFNGLVKTFKS